MAVNLSSLATFTSGDDTAQLIVVPAQVLGADQSAAVVITDANVTFEGNDTIIAYGNFTMLSPQADAISLDIPESGNVTGLIVDGTLTTFGKESTDDNDDDTVIGAAQLVVAEPVKETTTVYGIGSSQGSILLGRGNDIVAGLALGANADRASGIHETNILLGTGDNTVIGVGATSGENGENQATGLDYTDVTAGIGSDIVVGAGVASQVGNGAISANGMRSSDFMLNDQPYTVGDAEVAESGPDVVLGLALGLGGLSTEMTGSAGIFTDTGETGDGNDLVAGVVAFAAQDESEMINNFGIRFTDEGLQTNGGDDIVLGIVAGLFDGDGTLLRNFGFAGEVDTGDDNDQVIGVVIASASDDLNAVENAGIGGNETTLVATGSGDDLVLGLVDLTSADGLSGGGNSGIAAELIDTGADNDVVIGLANGAAFASFGISGGFQLEDVADADILINGTIDLGSGNDFVFARGASAGVDAVQFDGGTGNDVFDIHSGKGIIDGGDDMDTLILSGNMTDNNYFFPYTVDPTDDQLFLVDPMAVGIASKDQNGPNGMDVVQVEFFVFDDGTYTYQELMDANTFDIA